MMIYMANLSTLSLSPLSLCFHVFVWLPGKAKEKLKKSWHPCSPFTSVKRQRKQNLVFDCNGLWIISGVVA